MPDGIASVEACFAPAPLYVVHFASTAAWGLTPLADQQLAGLLMWVLAMIPYLAAGLWIAWSSLRASEPAL
ncbi:cytochrome c oxidase assembly protein [Paraburkholderia sediminicola]|uniref:Cytochrome c oxidase assembly protein n=1 Tax=Paraburkholderia rhynchosiae TaxID=487049 RepID=A0ACC7NDU3_9BURK